MTQYAFGSGTLIGKRTDVAGTAPCLLGTLQDVSIDFDRKIETLLGQYSMAVAAGGGEFKITGKAKFARLQATQVNNLFLGQTLTADSMLEMTTGESDTVASGSVTVTNNSNFAEDYGVFYAATGTQLMGGRDFTVAPLSLRQILAIADHVPKLSDITAATLSGERLAPLAEVLWHGLRRAHPTLTRDEFFDLPITIAELVAALPVVIEQAGGRKVDAAAGEI